MFSRVFNAQNKILIIPITAVTWEYTNNGGASWTEFSSPQTPEYTGNAFTIRVKETIPAGATYSQTGTSSTTNVTDADAQLTITGTSPYTGTFTSQSIGSTARTITAISQYTGNPIDPDFCGSLAAGWDITINGLVDGTVPVSILFGKQDGTSLSLCPVVTPNFQTINSVVNTNGTSPYQNVQRGNGVFRFFCAVNSYDPSFLETAYYFVSVNNSTWSGSTNTNYTVANVGRPFTDSCGT